MCIQGYTHAYHAYLGSPREHTEDKNDKPTQVSQKISRRVSPASPSGEPNFEQTSSKRQEDATRFGTKMLNSQTGGSSKTLCSSTRTHASAMSNLGSNRASAMSHSSTTPSAFVVTPHSAGKGTGGGRGGEGTVTGGRRPPTGQKGVYVYIYTHLNLHTYMYMYRYIYICVGLSQGVKDNEPDKRVRTKMYTHLYIHTYMYMYRYIYIFVGLSQGVEDHQPDKRV